MAEKSGKLTPNGPIPNQSPWYRDVRTIIAIVALCVSSISLVRGCMKDSSEAQKEATTKLIDSRLNETLKQKGGINETIQNLNTTTQRLDATVQTLSPYIRDMVIRQFDFVSKLPRRALIEKLPAVTDLVNVAIDQKIEIDQKVLSATGVNLVDASADAPSAWSSALKLVSLKSLNVKIPILPDTRRSATDYVMQSPKGVRWTGEIYALGSTNQDEAAQANRIGVDANLNVPVGPGFLLVEKGSVLLDGMHFKNLIFQDAQIHYLGGSVQLENVYFLNCSFEIERKPSVKNFLIAALSPQPSTNFSQGM